MLAELRESISKNQQHYFGAVVFDLLILRGNLGLGKKENG
jgi:hypothetical protein